MNLTVVNKELNINAVKVISISGSSLFLVGDAQNINCSSVCDSVVEYTLNDSDSNSRKKTDGYLSYKGN